jgi:radical SAM superfamily enzyme YgiQ (UPF0313 family)
MLDLLIINPGAASNIYGELGETLTACEPPLWCRLIAGYIRDRGFSVKIIDAEAEGYSPETVAVHVEKLTPRLVCLAVYGHQPSASTQQMVGASAITRAIKTLGLPCPVIMVGGHVSALPERTLREEWIDYACVGEGPVTIEGLLKQPILGPGPVLSNIESIPGLVFRFRDEVRTNPSAPLIDMKDLHGNTWDLLPMDKYRAHNWQVLDGSPRQPYASIMTSLNCPFKCSFCCISAPFGNNVYRTRESGDVVGEICFLYHTYGVKTFKIVDEMFVLNERHYTEICNQLIGLGLGREINIWCYSRIDTVKPHTLEMFRQAGIRWLALGIESGSKHVRDGADKTLKNDDIVEVVRQIQAAGIHVIGNYIFGLPDDDYVSMQETLNLALQLNTTFANFYSAMAYPGSRLYDEALKSGTELPASWRGFSQHNDDCLPLRTQHLTAKQVLAFRDAAFQAYFENPLYLNKLMYQFGPSAVEEIKKMTSYKLKRKLLEAA